MNTHHACQIYCVVASKSLTTTIHMLMKSTAYTHFDWHQIHNLYQLREKQISSNHNLSIGKYLLFLNKNLLPLNCIFRLMKLLFRMASSCLLDQFSFLTITNVKHRVFFDGFFFWHQLVNFCYFFSLVSKYYIVSVCCFHYLVK